MPHSPQHTMSHKLIFLLMSGQVGSRPNHGHIPISGDSSNSATGLSSDNLSSVFFPCGYCELVVTLENKAISCDSSDEWYNKECVDICSKTFEAVDTANVAWLFCKCAILTRAKCYHQYELELSNSFAVLNSTQPSNLSGEIFSPCWDFHPPRHSSPMRQPGRANPNN